MTVGLSTNPVNILRLSLKTSIIVSGHVTINDAIKYTNTVMYNNMQLLSTYEVNIGSCQTDGGCFPDILMRSREKSFS